MENWRNGEFDFWCHEQVISQGLLLCLTQLKILYYDVHTAEERCKKSAKRPKMCGNCESLKKERPGWLIIYDGKGIYGYHNKIAYVDNYDGWENMCLAYKEQE